MPKLISYQQMTHYDPGMDGEAICIIGYTGQGSYTIRAPKAPEGRKRREQRDRSENIKKGASALVHGVGHILPKNKLEIKSNRPAIRR